MRSDLEELFDDIKDVYDDEEQMVVYAKLYDINQELEDLQRVIEAFCYIGGIKLKKFITLAALLLAFAIPAAAEYPRDIAGAPMPEGTYEFVVSLEDVFNIPYSIPDLGRYGFKGEYTSDGQLLVVYLDCAYDIAFDVCIGPPPITYRGGLVFFWNGLAQSYVRETPIASDLVMFDAWWSEINRINWALGCFDVEIGDPYVDYFLSDECPLFFYEGLILDPVMLKRQPGGLDFE